MISLEVKNLSISFGGLKIVDSFQVNIEEGQLCGLIGPNEAGETTISNLLTGVYKPDAGSIELAGVNITGKKTTGVNQAGITRTFQNIRLFKDLFVLDDVKVGLHNHYRYSTMAGIFHFPNCFEVGKQMDERVVELLKASGLNEECDYKTSNLPYGEQRKLEIARVLVTEPKPLLPDEPAAGMDPNETTELMDTIHSVRDNFDMAILLIERDVRLVSGICEELTVLNFGQVLCQGETGAALHNPEVIKVHPGEQEECVI